jgi:hypothetical protein
MPFTLAHPAAALPFVRTRLVFSALVVGTMAPDMEYFLRLSTARPVGHTLPGFLWFTLPMGLVALVVWHELLKRPVVDLLPQAHRARLLPWCGAFPFWPARRLALILFSLMLGATTHVVWDSFTHQHSPGVSMVPMLLTRIDLLFGYSMPLYRVLQHASTFFGFVAIAGAYLWWYRRTQPVATPPRRVPVEFGVASVAVILLIACTAAPAYAWSTYGPVEDMRDARRFLVAMVLVGLDAVVAGLVLYGLWWRIALYLRKRGEYLSR